MTKSTQDTVGEFLTLDRLIINDYQSLKDKTFEYAYGEDEFIKQTVDLVKAGKKVICPTNSRTVLKHLEHELNKTNPEKSFKVRIYTAQSGERHEKDFENINEAWSKYDVVGFTTVIEAGISFEREHFDHCVAFFKSGSCPADSAFQQLFRARSVQDFKIFYDLRTSGRSKYNIEVSKQLIDAISTISNIVGCKTNPDDRGMLNMQAVNLERCAYLSDQIMEVNKFIEQYGGKMRQKEIEVKFKSKEEIKKKKKETKRVNDLIRRKMWTKLDRETKEIIIRYTYPDKQNHLFTEQQQNELIAKAAEKYEYADPIHLLEQLNNRSIIENNDKMKKVIDNNKNTRTVRIGATKLKAVQHLVKVINEFTKSCEITGEITRSEYENLLREKLKPQYVALNHLFKGAKKRRYVLAEKLSEYKFVKLHMYIQGILKKNGYDIVKKDKKDKKSNYKFVRI